MSENQKEDIGVSATKELAKHFSTIATVLKEHRKSIDDLKSQ